MQKTTEFRIFIIINQNVTYLKTCGFDMHNDMICGIKTA